MKALCVTYLSSLPANTVSLSIFRGLGLLGVWWWRASVCVCDFSPAVFIVRLFSSDLWLLLVCVWPDPSVWVEVVLLAAGERVGHANLSYASRMNKGVVVFREEERFVAELTVSSVSLKCLSAGFPTYHALHPVHRFRGSFSSIPRRAEDGQR